MSEGCDERRRGDGTGSHDRPPPHQVASLPSRLLVVADASHERRGGPTSEAASLPRLVERSAAAGARWFEIRRPATGRPETARRVAEVRECLDAARGARPDSVVLVNDRLDVALLAEADGLHVGQDDLPAATARELLGPDRWLGLSTHDARQLQAGAGEPVDYLAIGPAFASGTKSGHADVLGLERCAALRRAHAGPLVAIGGIGAPEARALRDAGFDAVAVVGAIDPMAVEDSVGPLLEALDERPRPLRPWVVGGFPGAGKSTVGPRLARASGRRHVDLDADVARRAGRPVAEVIDLQGIEAFRALEAEALEAILATGPADLVVSLGGGALEAPGVRAALRRSRARTAWLDAPLETCLERLDGGGRRPVVEAHRRGEGDAALSRLWNARREQARAEGFALVAAGRPVELVTRAATRVLRDGAA